MKLFPQRPGGRLWAGLVVGLAGGLATACSNAPPSARVPTIVHGEWTPVGPDLQGRAFHLSASELSVTVDASVRYVHQIDRVDVAEQNGLSIMAIHHHNHDGQEDVLTLRYTDTPPGSIRLGGADHVRWVRTDESAASRTAVRPSGTPTVASDRIAIAGR